MQDPTPNRYGENGTGRYTDHQDHMYGARFVQAATAAYADRVSRRPHFTVQNYLGYHNSTLPHALDPQTAEAKTGFLKTYAWQDRQDYCGSPSGCGDLGRGQPDRAQLGPVAALHPRRPHLLADGGSPGRLWAFATLDGRTAYWTRTPGGDWAGPMFLPGTGIDPGATAARLPGGRIAVLATRTTLGPAPAEYRREVVYAVQSVPDGPFGPWQSLGTPERTDDEGTSAISAPAVAVDARGLLTVYLRDSRRTLRASTQEPGGGFSPWERLGGEDLQGDPVTATDAAGRRHVYATTTTSVLAWTQRTPDTPLLGPAPTGLPATTVPLSASPEGAGIRLFFRRPDSGVVRTALVTAGPSVRPHVSSVTEAGGRAGYGAVGTAGRLIVGRADSGTVGTTGLGGPRRGPSPACSSRAPRPPSSNPRAPPRRRSWAWTPNSTRRRPPAPPTTPPGTARSTDTRRPGPVGPMRLARLCWSSDCERGYWSSTSTYRPQSAGQLIDDVPIPSSLRETAAARASSAST